MGKLAGIITGGISIVILAYTEISSLYRPLINWLGPLFGYNFPLFLGILGLIAGNPINHPIILLSWIIIGVVIGVFSGKGFRAAGVSILMFTLSLSLISLIFLSMFNMSILSLNISILQSALLNIFHVSLYVVPAGTSLISIKNEPVISTLYTILLKIIGSGTTGNVSFTLFEPLLLNVIENLIIVVTISSIVGSLLHRKKHIKKKEVVTAVIAVIIILLMITSMYVPVNSNNTNATPSAFSITNLNTSKPMQGSLNYITENGSLISSVALANNYSSNSNVAFAAVILNNNISTLSPFLGDHKFAVNGLSSILNIVPDAVFIVVTKNTYSLGASGTSNLLKTSGMTSPKLIYNSTYKHFNIYIYGQNVNYKTSAESVVNNYHSNQTMYSILKNNTDSGYYIPGNSGNSVNASILAYGFGNYSLLFKNNVNIGEKEFLVGIFENKNVFHSSGSLKNIRLSYILNYNKTIKFPSNELSFIGIIYPNTTSSGNIVTDRVFYSNNAAFAKNLGSNQNTTYYTVSEVTPYSSSVHVNYTFPAYIYFNIHYKTQNGITTIYTVLQNRDNSTLRNVNISESKFLSYYYKTNSIELVSGKPFKNNVTLSTNQYDNFSYQVKLNGTGDYVIPYASISYNMNNKSHNTTSNQFIVKSPEKNVFVVINSAFDPLFASINAKFLSTTLFSDKYVSVNIFDLILSSIVFLDIYIEFRGRRKS